ncbi:MAG: hypothetical protein P8189_01165 [Anaerolineae bacterium]|jgi:hypothetical protein
MCSRNAKLMLPWVVGLLALTLIGLVSCAEVKVVDKAPVVDAPDLSTSPLKPEAGRHDLAVLVVEFDPPLSYQRLILRQQTVALLAVVENTGTETERNATVRVELTSVDDPDFVLAHEARVESIAPGEVQIVRFARLGEIPYHQSYHLKVSIDPVEGELDLGDNQKAFDIQIDED